MKRCRNSMWRPPGMALECSMWHWHVEADLRFGQCPFAKIDLTESYWILLNLIVNLIESLDTLLQFRWSVKNTTMQMQYPGDQGTVCALRPMFCNTRFNSCLDTTADSARDAQRMKFRGRLCRECGSSDSVPAMCARETPTRFTRFTRRHMWCHYPCRM